MSTFNIGNAMNDQFERSRQLSNNLLSQRLYEAVFPVVIEQIRAHQDKSKFETSEGLYLMQQAHDATSRLIKDGIKHIAEAVSQVER